MASLNMFLTPVVLTQRRVSTAATAAKSSSGGAPEKGPFDWIVGVLAKEDQLLEVDPILKKVEPKSTGTTTSSRKSTVAVPAPKKKNGGFGLGGLFAKE